MNLHSRVISLCLLAVLLFSCAVPAAAAAAFSDVPDGIYYDEAVTWAVENDITYGVGDGKFGPEVTCTRGQIVTFLHRAAGLPEAKQSALKFDDVKPGAYYYEAVLWAVEYGITAGTGGGLFSPDMPCTRAQIVTFLHRYAGTPDPKVVRSSFEDVAPGYYEKAVYWAVLTGVTSGTSAVTFSPEAPCTRAQAVTFLFRQFSKTPPAGNHEVHLYAPYETRPATCGVGETAVYRCVICDAELTETVGPPTGQHVYELTAQTAPTCTEDGSRTYTCAVCGGTRTEDVPATGHFFRQAESLEPTCTEPGYKTYVCSNCGTVKRTDLDPLGHNYVLTESHAATATAAGYDLFVCSRCQDSYTVTNNDGGDCSHVWVQGETVPSTCAEAGYTAYTCTVCGAIRRADLPLAPHRFKFESDVSYPLPGTPGNQEFVCTVCGFRERRETVVTDAHAVPSDEELELLRLINNTRAQFGADPLYFNNVYYPCAILRGYEIYQKFDHTRPDGTSCFTVIGELGLPAPWNMGENIQTCSTLNWFAEDIHRAFVNSPSHLQNMTNPDFTSASLYIIRIGGTTCCVELFFRTESPAP